MSMIQSISFYNNNNSYNLWIHCTKHFRYILLTDLHLQPAEVDHIMCILIDGEIEGHDG